MGHTRTADQYGIPKKTLERYVKKKQNHQQNSVINIFSGKFHYFFFRLGRVGTRCLFEIDGIKTVWSDHV